MLSSDRWIALVLAALAISIFLVSRNFPTMAGLSVGPGLFPMVLSLALLGASAFLALNSRTSSEPDSTEEALPRDARSLLRVLTVLAACGLFAGLGKVLGFLIVGFLAVACLMIAFGVKLWRALLISGVTVLLLNLFFVKVMRIPLPLGVLAPLGGWL
ncbi:MAG: tripartite tricarboxylate transporter TctB family protein [Beijerinckiaceae bacterium]|jgi:putative tricarboxylic transport membrane protein|nr:tripartite tricarboxylate transporter TctB family protein [Beijerinckiaceae bacterium]